MLRIRWSMVLTFLIYLATGSLSEAQVGPGYKPPGMRVNGDSSTLPVDPRFLPPAPPPINFRTISGTALNISYHEGAVAKSLTQLTSHRWILESYPSSPNYFAEIGRGNNQILLFDPNRAVTLEIRNDRTVWSLDERPPYPHNSPFPVWVSIGSGFTIHSSQWQPQHP